MFNLIASITILGLLYWGFIRGYFFRGIVWLFSVVGMTVAFNNIEALRSSPVIILNHSISWSEVISFIIVVAAIITTRIHKEGTV